MFQLFQRPTCPLLRDSSDVAYISQLQAANEGSNERFFFRGQSNKNWDVRPCLFRENNLTIESDIISEACARAPFEFGGRSAFERLTKLQHYGLPTRMLDVTLNPLVALYLRVQNVKIKKTTTRIIKNLILLMSIPIIHLIMNMMSMGLFIIDGLMDISIIQMILICWLELRKWISTEILYCINWSRN